MSRVRFWSGDEVFRDVPGSGWAGRDCFGGQSGEGQWSGWLLMSFETLRVFHCRADGQGDEDVRELVACACARACLAVWLSVCSGATIQFALLLFT